MQTRIVKPRGRGACPTYFVGWCNEAALGVLAGSEPGWVGYRGVGRHLVSKLGGLDLRPADVDDEGWLARLAVLTAAIDRRDVQAALAWLDREIPRCMALVPRHARSAFFAGLRAAVYEDGVNIEEC